METLIAMGILLAGIMMASTIMSSSIRNINSSKNRVVAVNIAKEGLEAIRNIRDTNWLKFNSKRRECWNHDPANLTCDGTEAIPAGDYIVYKQPIDENDLSLGWKWRLEDIRENERATPPGTGNPNEVYYNTAEEKAYIWDGTQWVDLAHLYLVDLDPLADTDGDHDYENDPDTYNHALVEEDNALGKALAKKTAFRRQITIAYLDDDGGVGTPTDNRMSVRSKVTWQESKNEFSTDLATHLSDHLGRENLN